MMDLKNIDLLKLQTTQMQQDPTTIALCRTLNTQIKELGEEVIACLIYSRINYLSSNILDELAWQMDVDWYDSNANIDVKRTLIKNAIRLHRIKGTPQAVEDVVTAIFGNTILQEWFNYGGKPYFFCVNIDVVKEILTKENLKKVFDLINAYKNIRSWLEMLNLTLHAQSTGNAYLGSTLISTVRYILTSDFSTNYGSNSSERLATTAVSTNKYTLTNDLNLNYNSINDTKMTSTMVNSQKYELTNDITEETQSISNENQASSQVISLHYELS